ncbi:diaminopimelate decarboxylase [Rahnella sp. AA]|uniref:diaminopimelate decarboxylase n=1 Tax=Rahnella sp. AA TaxID=2057180 RepID=UPI0012FEE2F8|nr:diaminopimelate decarboxylase [Rahnella sp. AA]
MSDSENLILIAKEYGTPVYVYEEERLIERMNSLTSIISDDKFKLLYAMKANENPIIVSTINRNGFGMDACSIEEIELAMICGADSKEIFYNADCLTLDEIQYAFNKRVNITLGSLDAIKLVCNNFPGSEVIIRINTGIGSGHSDSVVTNGIMSKFGIFPSEIGVAMKLCAEQNVDIIGLHSHTGSGDMSAEIYVENARALIALSKRIPSIRILNFGGGFGFDYENHAEYDINYVYDCLTDERQKQNINDEVLFIIEPGRYIVADSAVLLTRVCSVKNNEMRSYIGLDTGYNHFPRCFYYNAWHDITNLSSCHHTLKTYDIAGYLCQSGDMFARERQLPETCVGDLLCIKDVGAYGFSMSSNFNLRCKPAELMITCEHKIKLIRRAEKLNDILSTCNMD